MIGPTVVNGGGRSVTLTADRFGNASSAIHFNGGYYTVPSRIYFSGDFTIAVWLKLNSASAYQPILDFGDTLQTNNVWVSPYDSTARYPCIEMYDPSQYDPTYGCSCSQYLGTTAVTLNSWFLYVLTLNGTTAKLYLNGTLTNTFTGFSVPKNTIRNTNYIGSDSFRSPLLLADLDDLRIYNRTLSQAEINILLTMTSSQTTTTTISTSTTSTLTTTSTTTTTTLTITSTTSTTSSTTTTDTTDISSTITSSSSSLTTTSTSTTSSSTTTTSTTPTTSSISTTITSSTSTTQTTSIISLLNTSLTTITSTTSTSTTNTSSTSSTTTTISIESTSSLTLSTITTTITTITMAIVETIIPTASFETTLVTISTSSNVSLNTTYCKITLNIC